MKVFLIIACVALTVRFTYIYLHPASPLTGDAAEYQDYAVHILDQHRFENSAGCRACRPPGYPVFLATAYALFGRSATPVQYLQGLIGTLTCLLLMGLAAELLPSPWPFICGLGAAFYFALYSTPAFLTTECLYSFFLTLTFFVLYRRKWPPKFRAVLFGLLSWITWTVRPEILPAAWLCLALMPFINGFRLKHAAMGASVFLLAASLWGARNYFALGSFVTTNSRSWFMVYSGLELPLERISAKTDARLPPPDGTHELAMNAACKEAFRALWTKTSLRDKVRAYAFDILAHFYPFLPSYDMTFVFLIPFWIVGVWTSLKRRDLWPIVGTYLTLIGLFIFVGGPVSRYRQGYSPLTVLLSAMGARALWGKTSVWTLRSACLWGAINGVVLLWSQQIRESALWIRDVIFHI